MKNLFFLLFTSLFLWSQSAESQVQTKPPGSGTSSNPYRVSSVAHLNWISLTGIKNNAFNEAHYILTQDIDASITESYPRGFSPIGRVRNDGFKGVFDGRGFSITNLFINIDAASINTDVGTGFIKTLGSGGTLKNINFKNATVIGGHSTGIALGNNYGTVDNVHSSGEVKSASNSNNKYANLGGLVGRNYKKILNSSSSAKVQDINSRLQIGGLVGVNRPEAVIKRSYSLGEVRGNGERVGGLVGGNGGGIVFSYSYSDVISVANLAGGFVGRNTGSISRSFSAGDVRGLFSVGGFVGYVEGDNTPAEEIQMCYSLGSVSGIGNVGGFVGGGSSSNPFNRISFSYAVGGEGVTGAFAVGGFAGKDAVKSARRNYYNTTKTGRTNSAFGRSLTNFQFRNLSNFQDWSPEFWGSIERSYPYLKPITYTLNQNVLTSGRPSLPGFNTQPMELVFDLNLSDDGNEIEIAFGDFDVLIDWGDGSQFTTASNVENTRIAHQYNTSGTYTVRIIGQAKQFGYIPPTDGDSSGPVKGIKGLKEVNSFGDLGLIRLNFAFAGAHNLTAVPETLPSGVTSLINTFINARSFNQPLNKWDVSSVTHMTGMFQGATAFNQPLNSWNTSSLKKARAMFYGATSFNQPLNSWNTSNLTNTSVMFQGATSFNQDLSNWDISKVEWANGMFSGAIKFDQSLTKWDFSSIKTYLTPKSSGLENFLDNTGMSVDNYNALIKSLAAKYGHGGVIFGAKGVKYTSDIKEARDYLKGRFWTFEGDVLLNKVPVADTQSINVVEGQVYELELTGSDPDGHPLSFEVYSEPSNGSVSGITDNRISYTANGDQISDRFFIRAYDGRDYSKPAEISIKILDRITPELIGKSAREYLGSKIAISGDGSRIAVGFPAYDGRVEIYEKGVDGWLKLGRSLNGNNYSRFGASLDINNDGTIVAIGGPSSTKGIVKVFRWTGSDWERLGPTLEGPLNSGYGSSVAISDDGSVLAIGANQWNKGFVDIYEWNGTDWVKNRGRIQTEQNYDGTGGAIALSEDGSVLAIGSDRFKGNYYVDRGRIRIYKWSNSQWSEMEGSPITGSLPGDRLGYSLSMSADGSTLVAGAIQNNRYVTKPGYAQSFIYNGRWIPSSKINGEKNGENFGYSVAIARKSKQFLLVGSNNGGPARAGTARYFYGNAGGWSELAHIKGIGGTNEDLGESVALSDIGYVLGIGDGNSKAAGKYTAGRVKVYVSQDIAPFARDQVVSAQEQEPVTFDLNSGDLNSAITSYNLEVEPSGSITFNDDGTATYLSESSTATTDYFDYKISTSSGSSSIARVTINIDLNDKPTIENQKFFTVEEQPIEIVLSGSDSDGDTITYELTSNPTYGSLSTLDRNKVIYTPNSSAIFKEDSFTYRAFDGKAYSDSRTITISTGDILGSVIKNFDKGDEAGYSVDLSKNGRTIAIAGEEEVSVYRWDGYNWKLLGNRLYGFSGDPSVSISANGQTIAASTLYGNSKVFDWNGEKWEQRGNTFSDPGRKIKISPDGSTLAIAEPIYPYVDKEGLSAYAGFMRIYRWQSDKWVQLGSRLSGTDSFQSFGSAIDLSEDGSIVAVGSSYVFSNSNKGFVTIYEWDGSSWNMRGTKLEGHHNKDIFGGSLELTPDGSVLVIGAESNDEKGTNKGSVYAYEWSGTDWSALGAPIYGISSNDYFGTSVDVSDDGRKLIVGAPQNTALARISQKGYIQVYAWDGADWTIEGQYTGANSKDLFGYAVAVSGNGQVFAAGAPYFDARSNGFNHGMVSLFSFENIPPYAEPQTMTVINGIQKDLVLDAGDLNGHPFGVSISSSPAYGNLGVTASESEPLIATYTANTSTETSDSFTYQLYDGSANSPETTVSITINQANSAPSVSNISGSVNQGDAVELELSGSDTDGDELTYEIVTPPSNGSAVISEGKVIYTNSSDGETSDSFTYRAYDGEFHSSPATASLTINVPLDLPKLTFSLSSIQVKELTEEIPFSYFGLSESGATYSVSGRDSGLVRLTETGVRFKEPRRINRRIFNRDIVLRLNASLVGFQSVSQEFTISLEEAEDADGIPSVIEKLAQNTAKYNRDNNERPDRLRSSVVHTPFGKKSLFDKAQNYANKVISGVAPAAEEIPSTDEMSVIWVGQKSEVPLPDENAKISDLQLTALSNTEAITFGSDLMNFAVTSENGQELVDVDETREGLQVRFYFEFGPETALTGDTYYKKKSDGSFVPFMAESEGDDGAFFTKNGDVITAIELTITDNSEWDDDPKVGVISDPGAIGSEIPDTTPPDAPTINSLTADAITGVAEANSTIRIYTSADRIVITSGVADDNGNYSIMFDEAQPQGLSIGVTATDNAENESEMTEGEVPDTTPPITSLSHDHDDLIVSQIDETIRISAFFNEAMTESPTINVVLSNGTDISAATMTQGDASSEWFYDWDVPVDSDGTATITVQGDDISGNAYDGSESLVFTIDNTAPVITLNSGDDIVESGDSWIDAGATADGGETVSSTGTVNTSVIGSYTITYTAVDTAGNTGTITREVTVVDTTAPTLTLTHNHSDTLVRNSDGTIEITAVFNEYVAESPKIDIVLSNGTDIIDASMTKGASLAEWTYGWSVPEESSGTATLTIKASDLNGNPYSGSDQLLFTIDNQPPEKPSISELTSTTIRGVAEVNSTVMVYPFPDNNTIGSAMADDTGAYSIEFDEAQSEGVTIGVKAKDAIGNESDMAFENVADTTAPTVVLTHDHQDSTVGRFDNSVLITATFNEAMEDTPKIDIILSNGEDILGATMQQGPALTLWNYNWIIPSDSEGSATISVSGSDVSGNTYEGSDFLEFTIDHTPPPSPPTVSSLTATVNEQESVTITLSGTDADGDSLTYEVVDAPSYGTVSITGDEAIYTSTSDAATSDSFTYRAFDGSLYSTKAEVSITINLLEDEEVEVNDPPTIEMPDVVLISEDAIIGSIVTNFTVSDPESEVLSIVLNDSTDTFEIVGNSIVTKTQLDFESIAEYVVELIANDGVHVVSRELVVKLSDIPNVSVSKTFSVLVFDPSEAQPLNLNPPNRSSDQYQDLKFKIVGGEDAELFTINSDTGVLNFVNQPDYESPNDHDKDNLYRVTVEIIHLVDGAQEIPLVVNGLALTLQEKTALDHQIELTLVDPNQDTDEDDVPDYLDNCYTAYNPDQADRDNDGVGDVCDDSDFDTLVDAIDACPDSVLGAEVNAAGCEVFGLPNNAFALRVTDPSCPGVSNGTIRLEAMYRNYTYSYTLEGFEGVLDVSNDFAVMLDELSAGTYSLCVEVNEVSDYQRCYTIQINEPEIVEVSSVFNEKTKQLNLDLSGSKAYRLTVNGVYYEVEGSEFTVSLSYGMNRIRVEGDSKCQGIVEEEIFVSEEIKVYPNPSKGPFEVYISGSDQEVEFQLNALSGRRLKSWRSQVPANRIVPIELSSMPSGMYLLNISGEHVQKTTKIILD